MADRVMAGLRSRVGGTRAAQASGRFLESPFASVQLMLAAGGGLLFFGLMMSASTTISASLHTTGDTIWSQLIKESQFLALSVPVFWLAMRLSPTVYRRLTYPALALSVTALIAVLIPGIGATINGAHRWIQLGPLTVQPSEFAKLAILLWGADLLARKEAMKTLTSAKHVLVPLVPGFAAMITLVMLEPDLGTSLCFMLLLMGLLWMVGLPLRYFIGIVVVIVAAVTLLAITEPYRLQRLTTFLHPNLDPLKDGFQTQHGLWALASGGFFGVGLGRGTLKYGWVPNSNTDYVFSVVGEELGLLGTTVVLLLFGLFTYAAMRIAFRSSDPFVRLAASGAAVWIAGQALINIGYVTALLPVTGIPLPFISNGGTSLILTCGVLGMLVSFARHEPAAVLASAESAGSGVTARWVRWLKLGTPRLPAVAPKRPAATARAATAKTANAKAATARAAAPRRPQVAPSSLQPSGTAPRRPAAARQRPVAATTARAATSGGQRTAHVRRGPLPVPGADQPLRPTGTESPARRSR
jgi:cell division protein FtsW